MPSQPSAIAYGRRRTTYAGTSAATRPCSCGSVSSYHRHALAKLLHAGCLALVFPVVSDRDHNRLAFFWSVRAGDRDLHTRHVELLHVAVIGDRLARAGFVLHPLVAFFAVCLYVE